ncbi:hypothetical protein Q0Z83_034570 [Actinoplanes sichuanensis]|uniref:Excreted virulence factor EspC, type VII ESX diderm n=1 Tax=Actinoplanes sichuanensis TaxID=512349 RepID=A0ABW4ASS3_9ACTN|nr:hypothetical protein [Actinoplanes sichuanensis]BEL05266.1 hypothetical protein Q0Z83_034570 [Actinoplanes sichuanensis]
MDVDIEGLRRTAIRIRTPLVAVDHAIGRELPRLTVTGPAAGWDFAPTLGETSARWSDYLRDLTLRVRALGDDLSTSANELEASDQTAARSFNFPVR